MTKILMDLAAEFEKLSQTPASQSLDPLFISRTHFDAWAQLIRKTVDMRTEVFELKEFNHDAAELCKLTRALLDYIGELEGDKPSWLETNRYVSVAIAKVQRHIH